MTTHLRAFLFVLVGITGWWSATASGLLPNDVTGKQEEVVRRVNLPCPTKGDSLTLYVARTKAKLISTVLVLCPDPGQDINAILSSPAWQDFAEDHHLGLVAVMATTSSASYTKNALPPPSGPSQAALVLQAVDHDFGGGISLLLYGWPKQTTLAESLLTANPTRVHGWCFHAPAHLPDLGSAAAPGIVVCYKENKPLYDSLTRDFARNRKKGARLTWITLAGDKPANGTSPALDAFVRKYLAAALAATPGMDGWENLDTKLTVGAMDLNTHPERMSYLSHVNLASSWAALHVPGTPELTQEPILEREEDTFNLAQPKLHLYLRKPVSVQKADGKIEGVLAFCTWEKEKDSLIGRLQNRNDLLVRYAEEHRLALLTWDTAQAWSVKESADQRSQQENLQDDLGFEKLANAWERGVHVLCREAELPENDFLLYGISRGAQWAHRLALRKPEHFLAIHIHINSSYDWPTPAAKNILWLQTTGEREAGYETATRFYVRCRDMGYPIIFKAGENLGHSDSAQIDALGLRFFDYALSVKARRDAVAANPKALRGKHASSTLYALSGLAEAPFYADFINQDVYGADEKDMVPEGQRVPLPTKALALAWSGNAGAPVLLPDSNTVAIPSKSSVSPATPNPTAVSPANYFGSGVPTGPILAVNVPTATAGPPAADISQSEARPDSGEPPPGPKSTPIPVGQVFSDRYRLAVQHAVTELPALAQEGSASNEAFLGQYERLKSSNDALLSDPSWPEQVARLVKEQIAVHPDFEREFKGSVERAVLVYPALAEADSLMNTAFLAEYHRLNAAGDALLNDPTWPEQVARIVDKNSGNK